MHATALGWTAGRDRDRCEPAVSRGSPGVAASVELQLTNLTAKTARALDRRVEFEVTLAAQDVDPPTGAGQRKGAPLIPSNVVWYQQRADRGDPRLAPFGCSPL